MSESRTSTSRAPAESPSRVPEILDRARNLVGPAIHAAVEHIDDERMRQIAGYQMGWVDAQGNPAASGGKSVRPALTVLSAVAAGATGEAAAPAAAAVELVHNFSLLHDDVMDRDVERRHRPTGWVVYGEGQAILAGNAMLTAAIETLVRAGEHGLRSLPCLLAATQELISGQSQDLDLEGRENVDLDEVLQMEIGKTAALLSCSTEIGAIAAAAPQPTVDGLATFGRELGIAFQLVDDVLGVVGDPAATGKSSSSDVRAGKRSATIVAALTAGTDASRRLAELFVGGPPETEEEVSLATKLIGEAGGLDWAMTEADRRLDLAHRQLDELTLLNREAVADLRELADFIVGRDR